MKALHLLTLAFAFTACTSPESTEEKSLLGDFPIEVGPDLIVSQRMIPPRELTLITPQACAEHCRFVSECAVGSCNVCGSPTSPNHTCVTSTTPLPPGTEVSAPAGTILLSASGRRVRAPTPSDPGMEIVFRMP